MAHTYQEHREHKVARERVSHVTKGYKTGGAVHHYDEKEDEALIKKEVKASALKRATGGKIEGKSAKYRLDRVLKRAAGGRAGKKGGKTNVNIIVGHPGGAGAPGAAGLGAVAAPPPAPVPPPRPPVAPPMGGPGMPPPGMLPPGGGPPMMPRARGGKVGGSRLSKPGGEIEHLNKTDCALPKRARGGNVPGEELKKAYDTGRANSSTGGGRPKDGPAWKEGLKNGTQISHTAGNTAGASLAAHEGVKKIRTYEKGGAVKGQSGNRNLSAGERKLVSQNEKPPFSEAVEAGFGNAKANPFPAMTAGGKSGVGRLQKMRGARRGIEAP